jgi:hypothetical protein
LTVLPGWRLTPNDYFYGTMRSLGFQPGPPSPGGPQISGTFAYAAKSWLEVSIDLFVGGERLTFLDRAPMNTLTYGAMLGVRFPFPLLQGRLIPHLGLTAGPTLILVTGDDLPGPEERLTTGYAAVAGLSWRFSEGLAATLEYKLILVRGHVPDVGGVNAGGSWLGLGITLYFPPEPSTEATLP